MLGCNSLKVMVQKYWFRGPTWPTGQNFACLLPACILALALQAGTANGAGGSCSPTNLVPTVTSPSSGFSLASGFPVSLRVTVVDNCGNAIMNASVIATFSNGDSAIALSYLGNGNYAGTWTPTNVSAQVTVQFNVASPVGLTGAVVTVTVGSSSTSGPIISAGGVVDSASFSTKPLSPGGIFSIFGTNLAASTSQAGTVPLPTTLLGTSVIVGGIQAPLFFISPGQINAMLPYELNPGQSYQIIVGSGSALSLPVAITVAAVDPGILAYGQNQVIATDANFSLIGPSNPAQAGDFLTMYCLGLGAVSTAVVDGAGSPSDPLAITVNQATVTVGTQTATVLFAGLTPTAVALYQINFQVPAGTASGEVPVTISVGGQTSVAVNLAVQ
jgi:uncharacterized protein (TIGR03437 family)